MRLPSILTASAICLICAASPASAGAVYVVTHLTAAQAAPDHMTRPLDDSNTVLYEQSFGGAGVATGLLFGPLGVAGNIAAIKSRTEKEAEQLHDRISIDLDSKMRQIGQEAGLEVRADDNADAVLIKPALDVVSMGNQDLRFSARLQIDNHGYEWLGRWELHALYPRDRVMSGLQPADLEALERETYAGLTQLLQLYLQDAGGTLGDGGKVKFHSDFLSPRLAGTQVGWQLPGPEARLTVRVWKNKHKTVLVSLPKDLVEMK